MPGAPGAPASPAGPCPPTRPTSCGAIACSRRLQASRIDTRPARDAHSVVASATPVASAPSAASASNRPTRLVTMVSAHARAAAEADALAADDLAVDEAWTEGHGPARREQGAIQARAAAARTAGAGARQHHLLAGAHDVVDDGARRYPRCHDLAALRQLELAGHLDDERVVGAAAKDDRVVPAQIDVPDTDDVLPAGADHDLRAVPARERLRARQGRKVGRRRERVADSRAQILVLQHRTDRSRAALGQRVARGEVDVARDELRSGDGEA